MENRQEEKKMDALSLPIEEGILSTEAQSLTSRRRGKSSQRSDGTNFSRFNAHTEMNDDDKDLSFDEADALMSSTGRRGQN
eukprot:CAMPEP_0170474084 /NCGR_PEP_ID=MMETSP0123-20130129/15899_1 /TAXON_ID=182087 /ORGANISM="Favella ehrenbergii, Strain Fehren 1" /LENGTH=80 /DNA_ID=CAMNT_0010743569 /DNA_START=25 /DNA_END=267 /DNA_ORIENTATION=+